MKVMWCWRCRMDVPMLDDEEFARLHDLYRAAFGKEGVPVDDRFQEVRNVYHQMTGFYEPNHNAIMHHQISIYGPPCGNRGKPLRTPQAAFCAACGKVSEAHPVR